MTIFDGAWRELRSAGLPLVLTPGSRELALDHDAASAWFAAQLPQIETALATAGALLFRGFPVSGSEEFARFVAPIPDADISYAGGGTPRGSVIGNVYEATRLPPSQRLPLHQEMSYLPNYPTKLAFYCAIPAAAGGETILGDIRRIMADIPAQVIDRLQSLGVRYSRNFRRPGSTLGNTRLDQRHRTWAEGFLTDDPAGVERTASQLGLDLEWLPGGSVTTHFRAPGFARHPVTGENVWFNILGVASYDVENDLQQLIRQHYPPGAPRYAETTWGDGSPISAADRAAITAAYDRHVVAEPWRRGDVLVVDNVYVCHGRNPYAGRRDTQVILLGPAGRQ